MQVATNKTTTPTTPFVKINEAAKVTGLSTYFIRAGVRSGEFESIRSGQTYFVNLPRMLEKLNVADWRVDA